LIADSNEAWILETVGKHWAAVQVKDIGSISNSLSIGNTWDQGSSDLIDYAVKCGWYNKKGEFHFARCYSDFLFTTFSNARSRQNCTFRILSENKGKIPTELAMAILRSGHSEQGHTGPEGWNLTGMDVCMHAGFGPIRYSQTTGSLIAHLTANKSTFWATATAAPCTSIFKPVWIDSGLPGNTIVPEGKFNESCLWWQHEKVHREIIRDYAARIMAIKDQQQWLESKFFSRVKEFGDRTASERFELSRDCYSEAFELTQQWVKKVKSLSIRNRPAFYFSYAWDQRNKAANFPI
jgi:secernin